MTYITNTDIMILMPVIWLVIAVVMTSAIAGYKASSITTLATSTLEPTNVTISEVEGIRNENTPRWSQILIHGTFIIGLLLMINTYSTLYGNTLIIEEQGGMIIYANNLLQTTPLILLIQGIVMITAYIVMIIYTDEIKKGNYNWLKVNSYDFLTIIFTNIIGLWIVIAANDLITLYIGIELQTFGAFILVAIRKVSEYSIEAALKYFILGAISSAILLLGIGLVYVSLGTTNYSNLTNLILHTTETTEVQTDFTLKVAYVFIMISLLFKLGAAPFHNWIPDVYQGATTIVTTYFVTVPKIGLITALISIIINNIAVVSDIWQYTLIFTSILSMLVGTLGAVNQYNIKRLLAFSAISHTGYLLIGIITNSIEGIVSIVIYLIIYIIMALATWPLLLNLTTKTNKTTKSQTIYLDDAALDTSIIIDNNEYHKTSQFDIKGIGRSNPAFAFVLSMTLLSIAGIPPLAGFYTKWLLFSAAVENGYILLALIGIVTSVIGAIYYLRVIHYIYFRTPDAAFAELKDTIDGKKSMDISTSLIISFSMLIIFGFLFYPQVLIDCITNLLILT